MIHTRRRSPRRFSRHPRPVLRFTPYAWAKLLFLRDRGPTEVGGFGLSSPGDLFLVEDFCLVPQLCTQVTVQFHDEGVADFFDDQVDAGRVPQHFGRIWIHTHPGHCAQPSMTDELTFAGSFGHADWAVMMIVAHGNETYARLRFGVGPTSELQVPIRVAFEAAFPGSRIDDWEAEYRRCVAVPERPDSPVALEHDFFLDQAANPSPVPESVDA